MNTCRTAMRRQTGPGVVIPHTQISVDSWRNSSNSNARLYYFCTHAHSDHLAGLQPSWSHPIYCSAITATLLANRFGLKTEILGVLELNSPSIVGNFTVTCLDANHCPGSVMFLFEGPFGTILHTGDFRYSAQLHPPMHPVLRGEKHVDMLYLDNTYCNPSCLFPSRDEATEEIMEIVRRADPSQQRVYIVAYNIGKEDLLEKIALEMKVPIIVSKERMSVLRLLGVRDVFTTAEESHIHSVTMSEAGNIAQRLKYDWKDDIVIRPTAVFMAKPTDQGQTASNGCHIVPYSDHSSYHELEQFVTAVNPAHIRGILDTDSGAAKNFSCAVLLPLCQAKDGGVWSPLHKSHGLDLLGDISRIPLSPKSIALAYGFRRRTSIRRSPAISRKIRYSELGADSDNDSDDSAPNKENPAGNETQAAASPNEKAAVKQYDGPVQSPFTPPRTESRTSRLSPLACSPKLRRIFSSRRSSASLLPSSIERVAKKDAAERVALFGRKPDPCDVSAGSGGNCVESREKLCSSGVLDGASSLSPCSSGVVSSTTYGARIKHSSSSSASQHVEADSQSAEEGALWLNGDMKRTKQPASPVGPSQLDVGDLPDNPRRRRPGSASGLNSILSTPLSEGRQPKRSRTVRRLLSTKRYPKSKALRSSVS